jgi:GNAT superfamily N-acetyltransferase
MAAYVKRQQTLALNTSWMRDNVRNQPPPYSTYQSQSAEDLAFLRQLYASVKLDELGNSGWNESQKIAFIDTQFDAQQRFYSQHQNASFLLVLYKNHPVGRVYPTGQQALVLIDMSLIKGFRSQGLGSLLMQSVIEKARQHRLAIELNIDKMNPSLKWYLRMNFQLIEERAFIYICVARPGRNKCF